MKTKELETIRGWMYRNARPLDLARWRLHFEGGSREEVYRALSFYQNEDGGFGHALEADCWNPHSSPLTTSTAATLIRETGGEGCGTIIEGILRYLDSGDGFAGGLWRATVPSNNDAPRAPWWTHMPEAAGSWGYNPSALLAGFCLVYAGKSTPLYEKALRIAREAVVSFLSKPSEDMHEVPCFIALAESLDLAGLGGELETGRLWDGLGDAVAKVVERDTAKWFTDYVSLPSDFIQSPDSRLYPPYRELLARELDLIENSRNSAGVWDITWRWAGYEREFAVSENWWKGNKVILNLLLLKNFGRI